MQVTEAVFLFVVEDFFFENGFLILNHFKFHRYYFIISSDLN